MFIRELSQLTGISTKTIRFYESIGVLPHPARAANNYREYSAAAVERLRFVAGARALGFPLTDVAEFLQARDDQQLPCHRVLDSLDRRIDELDRRIADLLVLRETLTRIHRQAQNLPRTDNCDEQCVCYLLTVNRENGEIKIQQENISDG